MNNYSHLTGWDCSIIGSNLARTWSVLENLRKEGKIVYLFISFCIKIQKHKGASLFLLRHY